jgi:hypothetical protein
LGGRGGALSLGFVDVCGDGFELVAAEGDGVATAVAFFFLGGVAFHLPFEEFLAVAGHELVNLHGGGFFVVFGEGGFAGVEVVADLIAEFGGVAGAGFGVLAEGAFDEGPEGGGGGGGALEFGVIEGGALGEVGEEGLGVFGLGVGGGLEGEEAAASEEFEEDESEGVDVCPGIGLGKAFVFDGGVGELFGGHVFGGASEDAAVDVFGEVAAREDVFGFEEFEEALGVFDEAKVHEFDGLIMGDHDIFGFNVAVGEAELVEAGEGFAELAHELAGFIFGPYGTFFEDLFEVLAVNELHSEEGEAFEGMAVAYIADAVRAGREFSQDFDFTHESLTRIIVKIILNFDSAGAIPRGERVVDPREGAFANKFLYFVAAWEGGTDVMLSIQLHGVSEAEDQVGGGVGRGDGESGRSEGPRGLLQQLDD